MNKYSDYSIVRSSVIDNYKRIMKYHIQLVVFVSTVCLSFGAINTLYVINFIMLFVFVDLDYGYITNLFMNVVMQFFINLLCFVLLHFTAYNLINDKSEVISNKTSIHRIITYVNHKDKDKLIIFDEKNVILEDDDAQHVLNEYKQNLEGYVQKEVKRYKPLLEIKVNKTYYHYKKDLK